MKKLLQTALSLILILTMIVPMLVLPMQAETPITNASVEEPSTYAALAEGAPTGIANTESGYTASGYTDIDEGDGYVQIGTKTQADATVGENYIPKLYYFKNANAYYSATAKKLVLVATNSNITAASDHKATDTKNKNAVGATWYLAYWVDQNNADILEVEFRAGIKGTTLYYIGYFTALLKNTVSVKIDSPINYLRDSNKSSSSVFNNMVALKSAGHGSFAQNGDFTPTTYTQNVVDVTGFTATAVEGFAYTFYKCYEIPKIITPTITGTNMFDRCKKVTQITVTEGATITAIGANTFKDCLVLEKIKINGIIDPAITIDSTAFTNVPDTVTVIVNTAAEKGYFENALTTAGITGVTVSSVESDTPVEADNAIKSEGFSVRMKSYTGLRALFSFDLDVASANQDKGLTLISYGAIASSYNRFVNEFNSDEDALFAQARKNTNSVVKYIPVYNADGSGANRYVDYESRTFCISLTHISSANALSDIYMAGYAIWVDANGNESYTLTSYNMADGEKAVNLYEITLGLTKTGVINSENTDDVCFWQTLKVGALRTKSFSTSYDADTEKAYTLPADGYYTYLDVDWHAFTGQTSLDGYAFNPTGVSTEASGVVWSIFKYTDDEYVLVLRNKDKSTYTELAIPQYTTSAKYNLFAPFHYKYGDDAKIGSAKLVNYNPALKKADFEKIKVAVVDHGITTAAASAFSGLAPAHTIVYPNGFTLGKDQNYLFRGCTALKDVIWCHTDEDGKPIEHLSEFDGLTSLVDLRGVKAINLTSVVNSCPAVENILFPSTSSLSYIEAIFSGCTALRRAWFDGLPMPADGTIDLTTIKLNRVGKETFNVGSNIKTIKLPDATKEIITSDYTILGVNLTVDYVCSDSVATLLVEYVKYIRANGTSGTTANYCDSIKINGKSVVGIINGDYDVPDEVTVPTSGLRPDQAPLTYEVITDPEKMPSTMEAWINAEDGTARLTVFGNFIWSGLKALSLEINGTVPRIIFGEASSVSFSNSKIKLNEWTHIALTIDTEAKVFRFYINGELSETKTMSDEQLTAINNIEFTGNSGHLCLGSAYVWTDPELYRPFIGQIASFCAYSDVRTEEEVAVDYKKLDNPEKDDLVLCYRFDKDNLPVYRDLSASKSDLSWKADTYLLVDELNIPEDYEYSIMVVGDTQTLVKQDSAEPYYALYDWLVDNIESKKIQAIIGVGDITHNNIIAEWERAKVAFAKLVEKVADEVVKFFPILGNHDVMSRPYDSDLREEGVVSDPDNYKSYLIFEQDGNNGSFDGTMKSYYYRFEMGGQKFLFLGMGYAPTQAEVDWAKGVVSEHSDYNVILSCHGYLDDDGTPLDQECATILREQLVLSYSNIVLVLCGHMHNSNVLLLSETREDGTTVQAVMTNPQDYYSKSTVGVATGLYFSNGGKTVHVANHLVGTNACLGEDSVRTFELDLVQNREE